MFPTTHPSSILCCSENSTSLENIDMEESPRHHLGHGDDLAAPVVSFSGSPLDSASFASVSPQDCRDALKAMQAKQGEFMPDATKIGSHGCDTFSHRKKVLTCMADLCQKLRFTDSTFFDAVNILDRFLGAQTGKLEEVLFPLIGVACVSIASKMSEVAVPSLRSLQGYMGADLPFNPGHIRKMEMGILSTLEWKMACVTPCTVLCYLVKMLRDSYDCISAEEAKVTYSGSMTALKKFVYSKEYVEYTAMEIAAAAVLRASLSSHQEMCCHDLMMQLEGGKKRSHDGTLANLCECMTNMESLDSMGPVYPQEYHNKRHISRSLSPTTPLGYYL